MPEKLGLNFMACGQLTMLSVTLGAPSDEIEALFAEGKALAERIPDPRPRSLLQIGYAAYVGLSSGEVTRCLSAARESLRLAEASGDPGYRLAARAALAAERLRAWSPARLAAFFLVVNASILVAWVHHLRGERVVLWQPTRR